MHHLINQFQERTVEKIYLALVERPPKTSAGRINAPIDRDPQRRKQMAVMRDGRPAVSEFVVIESYKTGHTLVRVRLLTGRTHQIRVHMAYIGCPVVGDRLYGYRRLSLPLNRQFLHAHQIAFTHPRTGERLSLTSPLPADLQEALDQLAAR